MIEQINDWVTTIAGWMTFIQGSVWLIRKISPIIKKSLKHLRKYKRKK